MDGATMMYKTEYVWCLRRNFDKFVLHGNGPQSKCSILPRTIA